MIISGFIPNECSFPHITIGCAARRVHPQELAFSERLGGLFQACQVQQMDPAT